MKEIRQYLSSPNIKDLIPFSHGLINYRIFQLLVSEIYLRDIKIDPIPDLLRFGGKAILVSNYPGVYESIKAGVKILCATPNGAKKVKGIAREEAIKKASPLMKILGVPQFMIPAKKKGEDSEDHELDTDTGKYILRFMEKEGSLLWLTATGKLFPDDLNPEFARAGPGRFSIQTGAPIIPVAYRFHNFDTENKAILKVYRISFGNIIEPPITNPLIKFYAKHIRRSIYTEHTKKVIAEIQNLLTS